jgi:hypothetical protein
MLAPGGEMARTMLVFSCCDCRNLGGESRRHSQTGEHAMLKPTYKRLTEFAKNYATYQHNELGDLFATSKEIEFILSDPWAWSEIWMDEARAHFCIPHRLEIIVDHARKRISMR